MAAIGIRTASDAEVRELAGAPTVPVINLLTAEHHPCQALADLLTLQEAFGTLDGLTLAYVGDGNNVARSLAILGALAGVEVARRLAGGLRARRRSPAPSCSRDPLEAVRGADAVYTDVWVSMGDDRRPPGCAARRWPTTGSTTPARPRRAPRDRAALPARPPRRGDHRRGPLRRAPADLGSGREPPPRAEGAAGAARCRGEAGRGRSGYARARGNRHQEECRARPPERRSSCCRRSGQAGRSRDAQPRADPADARRGGRARTRDAHATPTCSSAELVRRGRASQELTTLGAGDRDACVGTGARRHRSAAGSRRSALPRSRLRRADRRPGPRPASSTSTRRSCATVRDHERRHAQPQDGAQAIDRRPRS